MYYLNTGCFLRNQEDFVLLWLLIFFAPFPLKLEKRKLDKKPILLERDDILKQELDQDVDSILSGMKYWVSHLDKVDFKKFCCWYQTFLNRRKSSSYFLPKMCHEPLGLTAKNCILKCFYIYFGTSLHVGLFQNLSRTSRTPNQTSTELL